MAARGILLRSGVPFLFALGAAHAAEVADPPPLPSDLEERVEVRLVQLTLLALDSEGRPVTDLRPDELVVEDEGRPMEVAFLEPVRRPRSAAPHARLFVLAPGGPTRAVSAGEREPTTYVLLADGANVRRRERERVVDGLVRFLSSALGPTDAFAVLSNRDEIGVETPLSFDRDAIVEGVRSAFADAPSPFLDREARLRTLVQRLRGCGTDAGCRQFAIDGYGQEVKAAGTAWVRALEGAIRFAGGLAGRKVLVAVGPGTAVDLVPEIRAAADAASGIGSTIEPIRDDPSESWLRSLGELSRLAQERDVTLHFVSPSPRGTAGEISGGGEPGGLLVRPYETSREQAAREMRDVAVETGGTAVIAEEVSHGLERVLELERSGYLLGYYLPASSKVRKLRDVRVRATRRGVEIVAPKAYREREPEHDGIGGSLLLGPSIAVDTGHGVARRIPLLLRVDPKDLDYRVKGKEAYLDFGLDVSLHGANGETLVRSYHFVRHAYGKKEWKKGEFEPLEIEGWVEVVPGTYELRAVIHNARAAREGRWSRRFQVAAQAAGDAR